MRRRIGGSWVVAQVGEVREFSSTPSRTSARTSAIGASGSATSWSYCWPRAFGWRTRPARYAAKDLKRVTVDTTVQPKAITFPTDAKLLHAAIKGLNRLARRHGVRLRQSYSRVAKAAAMMAGRYAHAKQFNRHQRQLRILRSRLGRIIRDIRRKIEGQPGLEEAFALPLGRATQIRSQQQRQRGWKLYSFHAPEVECIGKGKAAAPYEFGVKASIVTNNPRAPGGLFVLHARALPDNPYDGHTLRAVIDPPRRSPAVRSSGPMSTRDIAATTRKIPVASSSPARSAASSASSSASSTAAPLSRP